MGKYKVTALTLVFLTLSLTTLLYTSSEKPVDIKYISSAKTLETDAKRVLRCAQDVVPNGQNPCLTTEMVNIATIRGPKAALDAVLKASESNPRLLIDCHDSGHEVGRSLYREKKDIKKLIPLAVETCMGAYIHGVFDAWEKERPSLTDFEKAAIECNKLEIIQHMSCYDGLAHILWRLHPEKSSITSICSIGSTQQARAGCFGGVLMQMYAPAIGKATNNIKNVPNEVPEFCANMPEWKPLENESAFGSVNNPNVSASCYYSTSYVYRVYHLDPVRTETYVNYLRFTKEIDTSIKGYLKSCSSMINPTTPADLEAISSCRTRVAGMIYMRDPLKLLKMSENICNNYLREEESFKCLEYIKSLSKSG